MDVKVRVCCDGPGEYGGLDVGKMIIGDVAGWETPGRFDN